MVEPGVRPEERLWEAPEDGESSSMGSMADNSWAVCWVESGIQAAAQHSTAQHRPQQARNAMREGGEGQHRVKSGVQRRHTWCAAVGHRRSELPGACRVGRVQRRHGELLTLINLHERGLEPEPERRERREASRSCPLRHSCKQGPCRNAQRCSGTTAERLLTLALAHS